MTLRESRNRDQFIERPRMLSREAVTKQALNLSVEMMRLNVITAGCGLVTSLGDGPRTNRSPGARMPRRRIVLGEPGIRSIFAGKGLEVVLRPACPDNSEAGPPPHCIAKIPNVPIHFYAQFIRILAVEEEFIDNPKPHYYEDNEDNDPHLCLPFEILNSNCDARALLFAFRQFVASPGSSVRVRSPSALDRCSPTNCFSASDRVSVPDRRSFEVRLPFDFGFYQIARWTRKRRINEA